MSFKTVENFLFSEYVSHEGRKTFHQTKTDSEGSDGSYVTRITNVTQNVMGKIGGISKITGNIGGIANKFGGNFMKF